ncbi:MAG TPA: methyltransferase domain-containing protein [Planctomycetota bacterium]|nr:methyltransferase domain-containing protein [Planctomycetota bacterium]
MSSRTSTWLPVGFRKAVRSLLKEWQVWRLHRRGVRRARRFAGQKGLKLHLGCGPNLKPSWVNIDLQAGADLTLDLREPLPFADGSCAVVYAEHFLEHLDYPKAALQFLEDARRVLQPDGLLSLVVPDVEYAIRTCLAPETPEWFEHARKHWAYPDWCVTRMDFLNYVFHQKGHHRFAYDFETLTRLLGQAGFGEVAKREFDPALDTEHRRIGSLYVRASNPTQPALPR